MTKSSEKFNLARGINGFSFDNKLAAYLAATGAVGSALASEAQAVIVANQTVQPFGINGEVNIDFNSDGQIDFQIDHDRVNLNGTDLDYLQLDKNDVNGETNPLPVDVPFYTSTFPASLGTENNSWAAEYVTTDPAAGFYPAALTKGALIGPTSNLEFQEGDNFDGMGTYIRVNRLIDEDAGKIDDDAGLATTVLPGTPNFLGLGGEVRYLGVSMGLNGGVFAANHENVNYGWIGIQITNEEDATGNVVGWGYQTRPGVPIGAGFVPEPSSIFMAVIGGAFLMFGWMRRGLFGRRRS